MVTVARGGEGCGDGWLCTAMVPGRAFPRDGCIASFPPRSPSPMVQYHALTLLYKIKAHDRLAISKVHNIDA